jgi:hypothetical protein
MRTVVHDWLVSRRPSRSLSSGLALVALAPTLLAALSGCAVTSPSGKITYTAHFSAVTHPAVDAPTVVDITATTACASGEKVLAGGYNWTPLSAMDEWLAAHPAPKEAQPDRYGLYRPIPPLLRVIESRPFPTMEGWSITVEGMLYPSQGARTLNVYAYCAAGLSASPQIATATIFTNYTTAAKISVDATCPTGTLATSGGSSSNTYYYTVAGVTKKAHPPVYSSRLDLATNGWEVTTDSFPAFTPYPGAYLTAIAVCVSTKDFTSVDSPNGPELYVSPTTLDLHMSATTVGKDTAYQGQYTQHSTCPAGAFLLPPSYVVSFSSFVAQDLRFDGVWVYGALDSWAVAVSTGGAATYPKDGAPVLAPYMTCLVPK